MIVQNLLVASRLSLKIGAQVMLVKNMPEKGLVNGSVGMVVSFEESTMNDPLESTLPSRFNSPKYALHKDLITCPSATLLC